MTLLSVDIGECIVSRWSIFFKSLLCFFLFILSWYKTKQLCIWYWNNSYLVEQHRKIKSQHVFSFDCFLRLSIGNFIRSQRVPLIQWSEIYYIDISKTSQTKCWSELIYVKNHQYSRCVPLLIPKAIASYGKQTRELCFPRLFLLLFWGDAKKVKSKPTQHLKQDISFRRYTLVSLRKRYDTTLIGVHSIYAFIFSSITSLECCIHHVVARAICGFTKSKLVSSISLLAFM